VVAAVAVGFQLAVGAAWSLSHDDPTYLELTARCFTREERTQVEPTIGDPIARSASGGTLTTDIEGNLVTVSLVGSAREGERLRDAYLATAGDVATRLELRGRYVRLWHRPPTDSQRQTADACEY
jgi:hypothetical protein